jgi:hypothetical protein
MRKRYNKPMTAAEIAAVTDSEIDYSDIPKLDDAFWRNARLVKPDRNQSVLETYASSIASKADR